MMIRILSLFGAFLAASASLSYADGSLKDDAPAPAETSCCAANWSGFYGAASIGYASARTDVDYTYSADGYYPVAYKVNDDKHGNGVIGSVAIGYDRMINDRFLMGFFGEYTFGDLDSSLALPYDDALHFSYDNTWAVGGRIGLVHCCMLFYVTAGYTSTDAEMTSEFLYNESKRIDGYFVGIGVERYLRDNLFLRAEYRYSDYEDTSTYVTFPCGACGGTGYERIDRDNDMHAIRVGLVYKFGREEPVHEPLK